MKAIGIICTVIVALQLAATLLTMAVLAVMRTADEAEHMAAAWHDALADLLTEEDR